MSLEKVFGMLFFSTVVCTTAFVAWLVLWGMQSFKALVKNKLACATLLAPVKEGATFFWSYGGFAGFRPSAMGG
jgi:hypothetical protein